MKKNYILLLGLLCLGTLNAMNNNWLSRDQFFSHLVGMNEQTFRQHFAFERGWLNKNLSVEALSWIQAPPAVRGAMPSDLLTWIRAYPNRAALFQGSTRLESLNTLNGPFITAKPLGKPHFSVTFFDPLNPEESDIRSLVTRPENNQAGFQVASTFFGMLEGGMINWNSYLESMLKGAAQGEELSICTAGATIYRKYFAPRQPYLLEQLPQLPQAFGKHGAYLSIDKVLAYNYQLGDEHKIEVGLHENALVTLGQAQNPHKKPAPQDLQTTVPFHVDLNTGLIKAGQIVNLVSTSAYSLRNLDSRVIQDPRVIKFCQMLLNTSYEATLKTLYTTGHPKVFLTLMGAGAFANEIEWIGNALHCPAIVDCIQKGGLDVHLLYRADPNKAHRSAQKDAQFLYEMLFLADRINGTQLMQHPLMPYLVEQYTTALYDARAAEEKPDTKTADIKKAFASNLAKRLMDYIQGKPLPVLKPISFTLKKVLLDGSYVGYINVDHHKDQVLVNIGKQLPGQQVQASIDPDTNIIVGSYVDKKDLSRALPKGLYYWRSKKAVKHRPFDTACIYQGSAYTYNGKPWNSIEYKHHPFG